MAYDRKVAVYGGGYTGKLCGEYLATREIPFYLVGRNQERLEKAIEIVDGRLGKSCNAEIRIAENETDQLTKAFEGCDVVINTVGPFMHFGKEVLEACLANNCHYLDTTGETDYMLYCEKEFGQAFADANLLLSPACSFMWVSGSLAAEVALENEGIDSVELIYEVINALPSVGSSKSFLRMVSEPQYHLFNKELTEWDPRKEHLVSIPHRIEVSKALPWGGGGEPLWYRHDSRVRYCKVLVAFGDEMITLVLGLVNDILEKKETMTQEEKEALTDTIGDEISSGEPEKDDMDVQRAVITCKGTGRYATSIVTMSFAAPYQWTGQISAEAAQQILDGKLKAVGFQTAAKAFDHKELIKRFQDLGYIGYEVR